MSTNVSVLTDQGKAILTVSSDALQANVLAHVNGDFSRHNNIRVYAQPYLEPVTGHQVSPYTLRMTLTHPSLGVINVAMPCFADAQTVGSLGGPPVILAEPSGATILASGATAQFSVVVASQTQPLYQWQKAASPSAAWVALGGQTASILVLTDVTTADNGVYRATVTNTYGYVVTTAGTLTVHP